MPRRITFMIKDDLDKKIRVFQAKKIRDNPEAFSYSAALNDVVEKGLDKIK